MDLYAILERIQLTLRHTRLQIFALWCLVWVSVAAYGQSLITSTFDPSLVNETGDYVGNPPLLILGCMALLLGVGGAMYYFGKWLHADTTGRSDDQIILDAVKENSPLHPSASPIVDKLNIPDRDEYFYSSAVRHFIQSQPHTIAGKGEYSPAFISQLASLSETYAFTHKHIAEPEHQAIVQARATQKQGTITPASPVYAELTIYLDTI